METKPEMTSETEAKTNPKRTPSSERKRDVRSWLMPTLFVQLPTKPGDETTFVNEFEDHATAMATGNNRWIVIAANGTVTAPLDRRKTEWALRQLLDPKPDRRTWCPSPDPEIHVVFPTKCGTEITYVAEIGVGSLAKSVTVRAGAPGMWMVIYDGGIRHGPVDRLGTEEALFEYLGGPQ